MNPTIRLDTERNCSLDINKVRRHRCLYAPRTESVEISRLTPFGCRDSPWTSMVIAKGKV